MTTPDAVAAWIEADPDPRTRDELASLDSAALDERFSDTLHFGTAGLRGPVRGGPLGMNVAVVTRATAGLSQWLMDHGHTDGTVVVGRDARHGSEDFFAATAEVLAAQGFDVVALPEPGPTPLVAYAVRHLRAVAGIQITASHNPPADNGYKVYLEHGAQLVPPADAEIEDLIAATGPAIDIPRTPATPDDRAHNNIGHYLARIVTRFGHRDHRSIRIALTAMHGVGGDLAVQALRECGFHDVTVVGLQHAPDPDFPTTAFPNPEEPGAADLLLALAEDIDADIAIALDPDADRCAVGAWIDGTWRMLTGDETGALLGAQIVAAHAGEDVLVANTIVSGSLLGKIAAAGGVRYAATLTGFKWLVRAGDGLVYAYEEAIGHCVDPDGVRDKDGISAAVALCVLTQDLADSDRVLADRLDEIAAEHGVHLTGQYSMRVDDLTQIATIMENLRTSPPKHLDGVAVDAEDLLERAPGASTDAVQLTGNTETGQVRVIARPSGTEPKLKVYLEVAETPGPPLATARTSAQARLSAITAEIAAFCAGGRR
jgi:phosphomannomutase